MIRLTNLMRVGVLLENQTVNDSPTHFISQRLATLMCAERINGKIVATRLSVRLIWLRVRIAFSQLKERFQRSQPVVMPVLNPAALSEPNLNLAYPCPHMESDGKKRQRELWLNATHF